MCTVQGMCMGAKFTFGFIQGVSICVQYGVCVLMPSSHAFGFIQGVSICVQYRVCVLMSSSHLDLLRVCLYVYSTGYVYWCRVPIWIYSGCVYMCTVWSMCIDAEFPFGFIQGLCICVQYGVCVLMLSSRLDLFMVCLYLYSIEHVYWGQVPIWIYSGCVYMCTVQGMCISAEFTFGFIQDVPICVQYRVCALVPSSHIYLFRMCLYVYSTEYVYWCQVHIWIYSGCVYMCTV